MEFLFRKGTLEDTETLIRFLDGVKSAMSQQEWFYLDPPDTVRRLMAEGSMELWMAMDKDRVAAVFTIIHPGLCSDNYGWDLALPEEELLQVIHMDTAAVDPDYRGFGLQGKMMRLAEQGLCGRGRKILLSTVHPDNRFSLNNLLKLEYRIQKRVGKYGSERYILQKEIF